MVDLSTRYLGLPLRSPVVASASPVTADITKLEALEEAGVGAVVLPSLFEEQLEQDAPDDDTMRPGGPGPAGPVLSVGHLDDYNAGPDDYLHLIAAAKAALSVPVIASLNGTTSGGWTRYAHLIEQAGADALELNIYRVTADVHASSQAVEREYVELVRRVRKVVDLPLAVKVGPAFTAFGNVAQQIAAAGAEGLVLFNRFYQPDIDLDTMTVAPQLSLSTSDELRLTLRWMALLHGRIDAYLAATTGIHSGADVLKVVLAGASVAMLASALIRNGPGHVAVIQREIVDWMEAHGHSSIRELRGLLSQRTVSNPSDYERANYTWTLTSYTRGLS